MKMVGGIRSYFAAETCAGDHDSGLVKGCGCLALDRRELDSMNHIDHNDHID